MGIFTIVISILSVYLLIMGLVFTIVEHFRKG